MRGSPEDQGPLVRVDGYGPDGFTISGNRWREPVILRVTGVAAWRLSSLAELGEEAARDLLSDFAAPGIVLVGTGRDRVVPDDPFLRLFRGQGLEPDLMGTGAACRTWNVLAMEGRDVIAGLVPAGWTTADGE